MWYEFKELNDFYAEECVYASFLEIVKIFGFSEMYYVEFMEFVEEQRNLESRVHTIW